MAERMSTNHTTNQIVVFGLSDRGLQRDNNEDHFMVVDLTRKVVGVQDNQLRPEVLHHNIGACGTTLMVADGVGGYEGGEIASQLAVDTVAQALIDTSGQDLPMREQLVRAVAMAQEAIRRCHSAAGQTRQMASTLTAVHVGHGVMTIAQVGDSRAYRFRAGTLTQLTEDQSVVQMMQKKGLLTPEEALHHPHRNIILQALGQDKPILPEVQTLACQHDDCLLLCSDGLSSYVAHERIEAIMASEEDEPGRCRRLVEAANAAGGADNVTVVLARLIISGEAHPEGASELRERSSERVTVTMRLPGRTQDDTPSPAAPANEPAKRPLWERGIRWPWRWPWRHKATSQPALPADEGAAQGLQSPAPLTPPEAPPSTQAKPRKAAATGSWSREKITQSLALKIWPSYEALASQNDRPIALQVSWEPEALKAVEDSLAQHIGPVAKILVGRAASRAKDLHELCQALATQLSTEQERQSFLNSVLRQPQPPS